MGNWTIECDSHVLIDIDNRDVFLSSGGPEESPMKLAAPSAKAKYHRESDSEQVP